MNPLRSFLAVFCLCAVLLAAASPAQAQNAAPPASDTFSPSTSVPKDARTRAQVHTELGSLYFQSGNLIVALEELTIATSIPAAVISMAFLGLFSGSNIRENNIVQTVCSAAGAIRVNCGT